MDGWVMELLQVADASRTKSDLMLNQIGFDEKENYFLSGNQPSGVHTLFAAASFPAATCARANSVRPPPPWLPQVVLQPRSGSSVCSAPRRKQRSCSHSSLFSPLLCRRLRRLRPGDQAGSVPAGSGEAVARHLLQVPSVRLRSDRRVHQQVGRRDREI